MGSSLEGNPSIERVVAPNVPVDPCSKHSALKSPILVFLFFHKAIRGELERLHEDALAIEKGSRREIQTLLDRYYFLRAIYQHHSNAEDERDHSLKRDQFSRLADLQEPILGALTKEMKRKLKGRILEEPAKSTLILSRAEGF